MRADAPTDGDLAAVLRAVQDGDDADALVDNAALAGVLDRSLEHVAQCLELAKTRSLIWGMRSGQKPAPWYTHLELTVQGRRFLAVHPPA